MNIDFLSVTDILNIHADQIERYGGDDGIRDANLLESAVSMPQTTLYGKYAYHDLFEMAAAYLFHIVQNHPFVDGNKRTGFVAAIIFLALNNIEIDVDNDTLADFVLSAAQGQQDKTAIADFFRSYSRQKPL